MQSYTGNAHQQAKEARSFQQLDRETSNWASTIVPPSIPSQQRVGNGWVQKNIKRHDSRRSAKFSAVAMPTRKREVSREQEWTHTHTHTCIFRATPILPHLPHALVHVGQNLRQLLVFSYLCSVLSPVLPSLGLGIGNERAGFMRVCEKCRLQGAGGSVGVKVVDGGWWVVDRDT